MIEKDAWYVKGYIGIIILAVLTLVAVLSVYEKEYWLAISCIVLGVILSTGMAFVQPNQAVIIQFLGKYVGTYRHAGLVMLLPFSTKEHISLRVKAYHSNEIIMYDNVEKGYKISLMLVYKIVDVAKAIYNIDQMETYIDVQSEIILRKCLANTVIRQLLDEEEVIRERTVTIEEHLLPHLENAGIGLLELQLIIIPHKRKQDDLLSVFKQILHTLEKQNHSKHY